MQVTQYGLNEAFNRARQSIFVANLPPGATVAGYMQATDATPAQISFAAAAANNAVLSQSFLRLIQPVTVNLNQFSFPVQVDQPTVNPGEKRLEKQDAMFVSNLAFYIGKGASATDVSYPFQTYPNPVTFPNGSASGGLYTLYNASMQLTINKSIIIPGYPMKNFMQIPQTQLTAATNSPLTQFDPSQVGLFEPTINLIGTKLNALVVNCALEHHGDVGH